MRIFHFLNVPLSPEEILSGGKSLTYGSWVATLVAHMLRETDYKCAVAAFGKTNALQSRHGDRVDCFTIPKNGTLKRQLKMCRDLVEKWKPDLIHIHGTELAYGLLSARRMIKYPTVISLQGLLGACSEWYRYFGNSGLMDVIHMHRWLEIPVRRGQCWAYWDIRKRAKREKEIIKGNRFFTGRTEWDKAYIRAHNPSAKYFYVGELLREAFWQKHWHLGQVQRHRVIFTNAGHPRKGIEVLLDAAKMLKPKFPDIRVAIAGFISHRSGYGRYIRRRIHELDDIAIELGPLNASQLAQEMASSHAFVSPSYIDNSPNSVCEAQLVGMPVISTYTGGVPSLIEEHCTGLFFPTGDAPMLAAKLYEVFKNDELATQLGAQAHQVACSRHDPNDIVDQVLASYEHVVYSKNDRQRETMEVAV